jgi:hypothetical protein
MGAIASGGVLVLNDDVVRGLNIQPEVIQRVAGREGREMLRREQAYRDGRSMPDLPGRTVILVDDGLVTGASMRATIQALRRLSRAGLSLPSRPRRSRAARSLRPWWTRSSVRPRPRLFSVGQSHWDFTQTTDEEVRDLLRAAAQSRPVTAGASGRTEVALIRSAAMPTENGVPLGDALLDLVGDAHFVLIGEASHSTHEFYAARASMTQRLIEEKHFCAVAVEGDCPDAYRVNRFVRGRSADTTAEEALHGFERFSTWTWRNTVVLDCRAEREDCQGRGGVLPVDVQWAGYLVEPARSTHGRHPRRALSGHLSRQRDEQAKIVVCAHNSHLGDARATESTARGELNVGQLVRERHPGDCHAIGFTSYTGTVTAADDWGGPAQRMWVRPALPDSVEELGHEVGERSSSSRSPPRQGPPTPCGWRAWSARSA